MKIKILLTFLGVLTFAGMTFSVKTAEAHFVPCNLDFLHLIPSCWPQPTSTTTPSPSSSPIPTSSPEPTVAPTATPCMEWKGEFSEPCETPVETASPIATPAPEQGFHQPDGATAPTLPLCAALPSWAPTVTYLGKVGNTFSYTWTTVKDGLHDYWVDWGFTPTSLRYSMVVHEEKVSITMFGGNSNWMKVAGYIEPGCFGPFSLVTN